MVKATSITSIEFQRIQTLRCSRCSEAHRVQWLDVSGCCGGRSTAAFAIMLVYNLHVSNASYLMPLQTYFASANDIRMFRFSIDHHGLETVKSGCVCSHMLMKSVCIIQSTAC